jgi:hypothetical protein
MKKHGKKYKQFGKILTLLKMIFGRGMHSGKYFGTTWKLNANYLQGIASIQSLSLEEEILQQWQSLYRKPFKLCACISKIFLPGKSLETAY